MRTKEEITKKKLYASDEPNEDNISPDKHLSRKRLYIILAISLTIGLSLTFVIYRQIKEIIKKPPQLKLPEISLSLKNTPPSPLNSLTSIISRIITTDQKKWNIVVAKKTAIYNWPDNKSILNQPQIESLKKNIVKPSTLPSDLLPQGLEIKEISSSNNNLHKLSLLINPPGQQLIFDFEYQGEVTNFKENLIKLIPAIYWNVIVSNP
jgi:hypothetical protein